MTGPTGRTGEVFPVDSLLNIKWILFDVRSRGRFSHVCALLLRFFIQERSLNTQITFNFIINSIIIISIHPAVPGPGVAPLVRFAADGHMITCDRGHWRSSGVSRGLPTSCQSNHLFIWLTDQLGPALAGGASQKGKVRGERRVRGQSDPDWVTLFLQPRGSSKCCRFHVKTSIKSFSTCLF